MTYDEAKKLCGMMGPKGSEARGYLQGVLGKDPEPAKESHPDLYEEAWLDGAEDRPLGLSEGWIG